MIQRKAKIAVIGIGYMGSVVAEFLARDGHDVIVWNRTREKAEALREKGVKRVASTVAEAIGEADQVWISLSVFPVIKEVLMTEDVRRVLANKHLISQTATRPKQIEELRRFVTGAGGFLSEVTTVGLPFMMRERAAIMVYAGQEIERWKPILGLFAAEVMYQGELGAASHLEMSLIINAWAMVYAAFFPIANMARQGLDIAPTLHILQTSPIYKMPGYGWWGERVQNRRYDDVQFTVGSVLSHVDEAIEYLKETNAPTDTMDEFRRYTLKAIEMGYEKKDGAAIFEAMIALGAP